MRLPRGFVLLVILLITWSSLGLRALMTPRTEGPVTQPGAVAASGLAGSSRDPIEQRLSAPPTAVAVTAASAWQRPSFHAQLAIVPAAHVLALPSAKTFRRATLFHESAPPPLLIVSLRI